MCRQLCFSGNLDAQTAVQLALPRNTSTKPNLESTKLAEFTPKEKCLLKPEPNTSQYMISGFWTLPFAANMMRNMKRNQTNPVESSGIQRSNWWRRVIKLVEDSQLTIVTKVVNKNLFSLAFSENSCADGSNYVPNLAAAMCFFSNMGLWT